MKEARQEIFVYIDLEGIRSPQYIGLLTFNNTKGREVVNFNYSEDWLRLNTPFDLDPDIGWFSGKQFPVKKINFGMISDSMPDSWGRKLMRRKTILFSNDTKRLIPVLQNSDYLLGVYDRARMGALRFKLQQDGPFLDNNEDYPTPPWNSIRELQYASSILESEKSINEQKKWLAVLLAPGSSLGGARPKSNVLDTKENLWIAKFPSHNDTIDKAAWEYLSYKLAIKAGIEMTESKLEKVAGIHHTFFTKRFDRKGKTRIHYASAMTMTGNSEEMIRDKEPSYLEIAEFIKFFGLKIKDDLHQLWRRIVFNICISNTDDHLRNHGFILKGDGWRLSPAFDINPSTEKDALALNIDLYRNDLSIELARSVGTYFDLSEVQMDEIISEVHSAVSGWRKVASRIGIPRNEQQMMSGAFKYPSTYRI